MNLNASTSHSGNLFPRHTTSDLPTPDISISDLQQNLNEQPSQRFLAQRDIEKEWKKAVPLIDQIIEQNDKWISLASTVVNAFKELGSLSTWLDNMDRDLHMTCHFLTNSPIFQNQSTKLDSSTMRDPQQNPPKENVPNNPNL